MMNQPAVLRDEGIGPSRTQRAPGRIRAGPQHDHGPGRRFDFDDHDSIEWEVASCQR
ncbi:hypothetical protein OB2597_09919 [Pseudooceanicola batsensis HTCC2597]|uniref:Uncharacterized protein n=1 Tax=Pseudooceanicola batsensis (strain ATCC BAA-863 / DSM 15984 / KCTC 12145 / HTCC2597) TaxID=252305 RepID=A3TVA6_PSEBH|nr:hypothetical protein OB2597_09919 [Pseudooceanicola batsensis HTCC2597]